MKSKNAIISTALLLVNFAPCFLALMGSVAQAEAPSTQPYTCYYSKNLDGKLVPASAAVGELRHYELYQYDFYFLGEEKPINLDKHAIFISIDELGGKTATVLIDHGRDLPLLLCKRP